MLGIKFLYLNIRPPRIENPFYYKTHQKVLKTSIRPSYNREIMVIKNQVNLRNPKTILGRSKEPLDYLRTQGTKIKIPNKEAK